MDTQAKHYLSCLSTSYEGIVFPYFSISYQLQLLIFCSGRYPALNLLGDDESSGAGAVAGECVFLILTDFTSTDVEQEAKSTCFWVLCFEKDARVCASCGPSFLHVARRNVKDIMS